MKEKTKLGEIVNEENKMGEILIDYADIFLEDLQSGMPPH